MRRAILIAPLSPLLTGCGAHKVSAAQTATYIRKHITNPSFHVVCGKGAGGWDYACTITGPGITGSRLDNTYRFDVNESRVTSQSG